MTARPLAVSHVTTITPDLDRYRRFYEDVIGLRTVAVVRMDDPPHLRHAVLSVDDRTVVHVFEQPGFDPTADGIGTEMGHRGRIDHLGFLVADDELQDYADRLRHVGASDGEIRRAGLGLTVHFTDPDGFQGEINARDQNIDPASNAGQVGRCSGPEARRSRPR